MNLPGVGVFCPFTILLDARLSSTEKIVYQIIYAHCVKKDTCWPSLERVGELIGISKRQVIKSVNRLIDVGHLERKKRPGTSSIYLFTGEVLFTQSEEKFTTSGEEKFTGVVKKSSPSGEEKFTQKHIKETNKKNHKNKRGEFQKPEIPVPPIKIPESNPKPRTRRQRHIPMTRDEVTVAISSFDLTEFKKKYPTLDIDSVLEDFSDWALWKNDPNSGRPNYEKWSSWNVAFNNWCRRQKNSGGNGSRPTLRKGPNPADNPGYEDMFR